MMIKTSYYTGYSKSVNGYKPDNEYFNIEHINQRIKVQIPAEGEAVIAYCFSLTDSSVLIITLESELNTAIDSRLSRKYTVYRIEANEAPDTDSVAQLIEAICFERNKLNMSEAEVIKAMGAIAKIMPKALLDSFMIISDGTYCEDAVTLTHTDDTLNISQTSIKYAASPEKFFDLFSSEIDKMISEQTFNRQNVFNTLTEVVRKADTPVKKNEPLRTLGENWSKNQLLANAVLNYYSNIPFNYSDECWENNSLKNIVEFYYCIKNSCPYAINNIVPTPNNTRYSLFCSLRSLILNDNSFDKGYAYVLLFLFSNVSYEELRIRLSNKQDKYICEFINTIPLSAEHSECLKMIRKKVSFLRNIRLLLMIKRRR